MAGLFGTPTKKKTAPFNTWINEKLIPKMGKLSNQIHLSSIRDSFAILTPLLIASAFASVIAATVFGNGGSSEQASLLGVFAKWGGLTVHIPGGATGPAVDTAFKFADGSLNAFGTVAAQANVVLVGMQYIGNNALAIYFVFIFGFFLSRARGNDAPEIGALVAVGVFMIATLGANSSASYIALDGSTRGLSSTYLDSNGLFAGLILTLGAVELYNWLSKVKKIQLTMPAGVPPAIARGFAKMIPVLLTAMAVSALFAIVAIPTFLTSAPMLTSQTNAAGITNIYVSNAAKGSFWNVGDLVFIAVQLPFIYAATIEGANLAIGVIFCLLAGLFWLFGLHGLNISLGIFLPVLLTLLLKNNADLQDPTRGVAYVIANGSIFNLATLGYVLIGGSGATLSLLIATLIFGKSKSEREVAKYSMPAGAFNINEPVIFGYPMVLNPVYAVPFVFVMPVLVVTTWVFHKAFGTLPPSENVGFTTPVGLGVLFSSHFDYSSFIILLINVLVAFFAYLPFVFLSNRQVRNAEKERVRKESAAPVELG